MCDEEELFNSFPFAASDVCAASCYYKSLDRIDTWESSEIIYCIFIDIAILANDDQCIHAVHHACAPLACQAW